MAKSRFEYVKNFELPDPLLPNSFIVVRIDGRGFHKFSDTHSFEKPNDYRALQLMNRAAQAVMEEFGDVTVAFGESDEYSKINSAIVSTFTSAYVFFWSQYLSDTKLLYPPTFDSRVVLYPGVKELKDYFSWRQADAHINNLYNTTFWALIQQGGMTSTAAHKTLQGTFSKDKNEILYTRYGINYNTLPAIARKGSTLVRKPPIDLDAEVRNLSPPNSFDELTLSSRTSSAVYANIEERNRDNDERLTGEREAPLPGKESKEKRTKKPKAFEGTMGEIVVIHEDLIKDTFWEERPWLLS